LSNELIGYDNTRIDWSGGIVNGAILLGGQTLLVISGSGFALDGVPVSGDITGVFGGQLWNEPSRRLTGTLANGDPINNLFQIGDTAGIYLLPEPATFVLLSLGLFVLRRPM
jgi:hypothetical protein